jgi:hypothetical protein
MKHDQENRFFMVYDKYLGLEPREQQLTLNLPTTTIVAQLFLMFC